MIITTVFADFIQMKMTVIMSINGTLIIKMMKIKMSVIDSGNSK